MGIYWIRNAQVYGPEPMGKNDILICNDKIAAIGPELSVGLPGVTVIDAAGKIAVPGLIDQHVHVTGGGGEGGFCTRVPEFQLSSAVRAGVTTLVGVLGTDSFTRSVENLVAKTKALKQEGLTAYCLTGAYRFPSDTVTGSVARDIVFLDEVLGCKLAIADHRCSHPSREEILRLVSDIRMASLVAGKPGVLHVHVGGSDSGIELLMDLVRTTDLPIWHFRPTHMGRHLEQALQFTAMGGYVDISTGPDTPAQMQCLLEEADWSLVTMSSDSNGSLPVWNEKHEAVGIQVASIQSLFDTFRALVRDCGIPLEQALRPVTANVASALRLSHKGVLRPGADADLLLLDEDLHLDTVLARGRVMLQEGQVLVKGTFEA